jgi:hypothetical protein
MFMGRFMVDVFWLYGTNDGVYAELQMFASGQEAISVRVQTMSDLTPISDIDRYAFDVRFGQKATLEQLFSGTRDFRGTKSS